MFECLLCAMLVNTMNIQDGAIVTDWNLLWVKVVFSFQYIHSTLKSTCYNSHAILLYFSDLVWVCVYVYGFFLLYIFTVEYRGKPAFKKYCGGIFKASQPSSFISTQCHWVLVVATALLTNYEQTRQPHSYKSSLCETALEIFQSHAIL